ncbi:hypothetical protein PHYSODRAFT_337290 [Phytophthora sojae]|uniref:MULE transposase domain-containing protein n=1 Tax=Phytophthora sojae (strain P6497) TaxID=1094619 RepID=G5A090_PHYSP|nr:hypothetical protein PHYSODRAFT_337290 [Phytophthora sojae]EGZ10479.1 hypothetical protein PHYSODRAFT_337290 [Phytophthora sojae]|eukprot:XP_009533224.1 hypothetical protein PHYSODRAFT_337290 [Phytophthora sojae]
MVHFVVQSTDQQLEPAETQFPNAIVIGCLFHLKQALRRAMKRFLIPEEECGIAMTHGVLDMLTVVDHSLIERCIKWVKREIRQCFDYDVSVWNVAGLNNEHKQPSRETLSAEYIQRLADVPRGRARRTTRERFQLPVPVDLPDDIPDDSDGDTPAVTELPSDSSSDEDDGEAVQEL